MRSSVCLMVMACLIFTVAPALAQSDRGTITGTISDPAGAMIPKVSIEAKNTETGAIYQNCQFDDRQLHFGPTAGRSLSAHSDAGRVQAVFTNRNHGHGCADSSN